MRAVIFLAVLLAVAALVSVADATEGSNRSRAGQRRAAATAAVSTTSSDGGSDESSDESSDAADSGSDESSGESSDAADSGSDESSDAADSGSDESSSDDAADGGSDDSSSDDSSSDDSSSDDSSSDDSSSDESSSSSPPPPQPTPEPSGPDRPTDPNMPGHFKPTNRTFFSCMRPQHCLDQTCGQPFPLTNAADLFCPTRPCTIDDYGIYYGPCDARKKTRDALFYWKPPAICRGGVALPDMVRGLPCTLHCAPGERLDVATKTCVACEGGTYSVGGGVRVDDWTSLPPALSTECYGYESDSGEYIRHRECDTWQVKGTHIESGNNWEKNELQSSLTMEVNLEVAGKVSFAYKVEAEHAFDGLLFYTNETRVFGMTSTQLTWETVTVDLPPGMTTLRWVYQKDITWSFGADVAKLQFIEVTGISLGAPQCTPCAPGHSSEAGASKCVPCPANTYASRAGADKCSPCKDKEWSPEGSVTCVRRAKCEEGKDYFVGTTPCVHKKQTEYQVVLEPLLCMQDSVPKHENKTIDCVQTCQPGSYLKGDACEYCPEGQFTDKPDQRACAKCPAGTRSVKKLVYMDFDQMPPEFSQSCEGGKCVTGWVAKGDRLESGVSYGDFSESILTVPVDIVNQGLVTFEFALNCRKHGGALMLFADTTRIATFNCAGKPDQRISHTYYLIHGTKRVTFKFEKYGVARANPNMHPSASLYGIFVSSNAVGGAAECVSCPAGWFSASEGSPQCEQCPVGTFSTEGASTCTPCTGDTFSDTPGASECTQCGEGTEVLPDHTGCTFDCHAKLRVPETFVNADGTENTTYAVYEWDFSRLTQSEMRGPVFRDEDHSQYFINVCDKAHNASKYCTDDAQNAIPTFACREDFFSGAAADLIGDVAGWRFEKTEAGEHRVLMTLEHGSKGCDAQDPQRRRSGTVRFLCASEDESEDVPTIVESGDPCVTSFEWSTVHGCRTCTQADMKVFVTECQNGMRYTQYSWKEGRTCYGGVALPEERSEECNDYSVARHHLVAGLAFVLIGVLALPLILLLAYKYNKYRTLYAQYQSIAVIPANTEDQFDETQPHGGEDPMAMQDVAVEEGRADEREW